jgi:hypothetical protein
LGPIIHLNPSILILEKVDIIRERSPKAVLYRFVLAAGAGISLAQNSNVIFLLDVRRKSRRNELP